MATTPKGIYYPNDYNEIADIPEDMKKMAESIDEIFEDTDSDLSDIKEEQTTQNNRLNSLEVDNTTNKSDILTNKQEINNIKTEQTTQNNRLNNLETDNTTNKENISANTQEINNIKQEQTTQNTNISNNATNIESLQEENENLKKIVAQLPQVPGQGTSITLENTIEAPFTIFDVEGNSFQDGSPSPDNEVPILSAGDNENLLDLNDIITTDYITNNGDGSITLNGTGSSGVSFPLKEPFTLKANNTYILSLTNTDSNYSAGTLILRNGNTNICFINYNVSSVSYTPSQDTVIDTLRIYGGGVTFNNFTFKAKLEKGNKATPYSPYGMGSINEKISNKNLAYVEVEGKFRQYADGKFFTNASYNSYIAEVEESTQYTAVSLAGATNFSNLCQFDENMNFLEGNPFTGGSTKQFTTVTNCKYITIAVRNTIEDFMVVKGTSIPTLYVPHQEQDYSIFVQQPMRSNKDKTIKDKFVIKSDNKKYERHFIGEVVLNGTENIARELISNNVYKFYINNIENVDYGDVNYVPQILCNKLIAVARTPLYLNTQGISSGNGNLQIYTDETKNMTVSEFKTWLENNNLIVNYLKTIPTDLPCTSEQIQQIENKPSTYKEMTIINSEDETEAYLEVSGIYDLNKLITRTEILESES